MKISIERVSNYALIPQYQTSGASGMDLHSVSSGVTVQPGSWAIIPTGIKIAMPPGYEGQIRSRSGLAAKHGLVVLNSPGTIDSDYRGEVKVILYNAGSMPQEIGLHDRMAQLVIAPVQQISWMHQEVRELPSDRGSRGFGSTGQ